MASSASMKAAEYVLEIVLRQVEGVLRRTGLGSRTEYGESTPFDAAWSIIATITFPEAPPPARQPSLLTIKAMAEWERQHSLTLPLKFEGSCMRGACEPSAGTDSKFHSKIAEHPAPTVRMRKFLRTSPTCGSPTIGAPRHGISRHTPENETMRSPFSRVVTTASRGGLHGGMGGKG